MGWCPRTGGGQRLMRRTASHEFYVWATCQDKDLEKVTPRANLRIPFLISLGGVMEKMHKSNETPSNVEGQPLGA